MGWFKTQNSISLIDITKAIKWQLKYSLKLFNLKWLVLIKKSNKFVYRVNLNLGFKPINDHNQKLIKTVSLLLGIKNSDKYYYLVK